MEKKYSVVIESITHEFWEVCAKDKDEAIEFYNEGKYVNGKPKQDELIHIEEIKERNK
tara:strand:- start:1468 stop:1641 length:174 start_codon:yes stop_codon:yes gene_type:complete